ncbi:MAG: efflux RND transporter permease subunit [Planctomycetota bacterium]
MLKSLIRFSVRNPGITMVLVAMLLAWGWHSWNTKTVDAIPDISDNQVVVVTSWPGRSPEDVEDQITQPLASGLSSVRGVAEVRGLSGFGFSQVYVVFEDKMHLVPSQAIDDFYEARTRILEKLAVLTPKLPEGATPELGPDATALGQIFMYSVEGPYDLATLRSIQDFVVRDDLQAVKGVAEVASIGGMQREYQVDLDVDRMRRFGVKIEQVAAAIKRSNIDVGAKTIEQGGGETIVRGLGFVRERKDLERVVVGYMTETGFSAQGMTPMGGKTMSGSASGAMNSKAAALAQTQDTKAVGDRLRPHRPVYVEDLGQVTVGPAFRRGALADGKSELVGGIVAMRFGQNPRDVIGRIRTRIQRLNDPQAGILPDKVKIRPFYDRTQLTDQTVVTLETALRDELLITAVIVLLFLLHVRSSLIVAVTLPAAVLVSFILMDALGVDSNIMSLTGIAIAIGTMVDMAIVMTENVYRGVCDREPGVSREEAIEAAAIEVGPALLTAVATTIVSFVPIFFLTDMEGRLFRPLAWTKTLALLMAAFAGILLVPVLCRIFLDRRFGPRGKIALTTIAAAVGGALGLQYSGAIGAILGLIIVGALGWRAAVEKLVPFDRNPVSRFIRRIYEPMLRWFLGHKLPFIGSMALFVLLGIAVAIGGKSVLRWAEPLSGPKIQETRFATWFSERFPGLGQEFMPPLDEGSLLYMPSLLPQASLSQALEVMKRQNAMMETVPEVMKVVGKLGRAETALDPAPISMIETVVILKPKSEWRPNVFKRDIVAELLRKTHVPGVLEGAGAWLQPIETRVIMLNSGLRAPMAIQLIGQPRDKEGRSLDAGDSIEVLEAAARQVRDVLKTVPGVAGPNVENLGGKPYLEIKVDRIKAGHWGLSVADVQNAVKLAIGGAQIDQTVEGRERYGIRVAWARERRDDLESIRRLRVRSSAGREVFLEQVADISFARGPAAIKTEDGRVRLHVTFAAAGADEATVMNNALDRIEAWRRKITARGEADPIPAGVDLRSAGRFESAQRARDRFMILIPICLAIIFFLLYLQFRSWGVSLLVLSALPTCIAGGLIMLAVYPGLRDFLFSIGVWDEPSSGPIYITVAVIVGFIALAGIATDDGVVVATYLEQSFKKSKPTNISEVREAVVQAGLRRIRPCLMTTMTTIIALYPILASTGRGSDVAQPMALPAVGGMFAELLSLFIVPVMYCWYRERGLKRPSQNPNPDH